MAARVLFRPRTVAAVAAGAATLTFLPRQPLYAEAPPTPPQPIDSLELARRKPIYDDSPISPIAIANPSLPTQKRTTKPSEKEASDSPTAQLATQVKRARVALYGAAAQAEDATNNLINRAFNLEHDFTSTLAGLAPSRQSGEQLMPGGLYVLVAAMGGSILTRNRIFLLRWTVPVLFGVGAGWMVIPVTMANVSELVWKYEKKFPVVADTHLRVKDSVTHFVQTGVAHSKMGAAMLEEKIGDAREKLEEWVSKGK